MSVPTGPPPLKPWYSSRNLLLKLSLAVLCWIGLTGIFWFVAVFTAVIIDIFTPFELFDSATCSPAYRDCLYGSGPIVGWVLWVSPCLSLAFTGSLVALDRYRRRIVALVLVPVVPGLLAIGYVVTTFIFTPGEQIVFASNRDRDVKVFIMDTDGNNITDLITLYPANKSSWGYREAEASFAWSPDGKQIAYTEYLGIETIDSDGYGGRYLTQSILGADFSPSWSPDGNRIAFTRILANSSVDIYVVNAVRSTHYELPRRLTTHPAADVGPSWSPDGTRIAFASTRSGTWDIYLMDTSGGNIQRLPTHPKTDYSHSPSWSPDGNRIAFVGYRENDWNIYAMNSDGTNIQRLTTHPAADVSPSWSPDGTRIAFASEREGNWDIYVMDATGGNIQRLTDSPWKDFSPEWSPARDPLRTLIATG